MDREHERHVRECRSARGRAVENIYTVLRGQAGKRERIPCHVARELVGPASSVHSIPPDLDRRVALERLEQSTNMPRCSGARERERRDVDANSESPAHPGSQRAAS